MSSLIFEKAVQRLSQEKLNEVRLSIEVVERIYDLMEKHAINQKELAVKLGKHPSEINKWLSGTHNFTFKTIIRLENIFGESILSVSQTTSELVNA
jgi:transcriptional regulator with XRE-family HTH domain